MNEMNIDTDTKKSFKPLLNENVFVRRMDCARIPTEEGEFKLCFYDNNLDDKEHLAIVMGDVEGKKDVLLRIHSECFTGDVLGSQRCDCGEQLHRAMDAIAQEGHGVIIYMRQEGRGIGLLEKLRAYNLQDKGYDTVDANILLGHGADERDYTLAALIIRDLNLKSIRLLTNNPAKVNGLKKLGIDVKERVPHLGDINPENMHYLETKVSRMHHMLWLGQSMHHDSSDHDSVIVKQIVNRLEAFDDDENLKINRPYVTLSYAQSLDGSIAKVSGVPFRISNPLTQKLTHSIRSVHDSILVGIGTVISDNPKLTVRLVKGDNPQPLILDTNLRFPLKAKLLHQGGKKPWIFSSKYADPKKTKELNKTGAQVYRIKTNSDGMLDLNDVLEKCHELGIKNIMVEGGAKIITNFIKMKLVDQIVQTISPQFLGGLRAVNEIDSKVMKSTPTLKNINYQSYSNDMVIRGDLDWK